MTRPRLSSSTMLWTMVLLEAISSMKPKPAPVRKTPDSHGVRLRPRAASDRPKPAVAASSARPSLAIERRDASHTAASRAPTPEAVISIPSMCGPPPRIWPAKIGISTA